MILLIDLILKSTKKILLELELLKKAEELILFLSLEIICKFQMNNFMK
eukprot:CAMPEP_0205820942 /NCGR_PEP_ID=MMETSP0206-20130828/3743_1 /ASSEMBLY_ACC=CAM_ASM_000279 /TAXON_ID=36767 /ORGANISM="Euplotes focardii, Strain TN1" /LENGTH=47 /DNA_ID= /DNA_START= /DNA_END= /DNA_ORIENTATION=